MDWSGSDKLLVISYKLLTGKADKQMAITLLIIETNRFLRQNLLRHMDSDRFRIIEYERKPELKNILRRNEIDVVLLGLDELKHEGLLLLKMIKKVRPLTEVILILTMLSYLRNSHLVMPTLLWTTFWPSLSNIP